MRYAHLGSTGLQVSRICLGCMSYGTPSWRDWVLDEAASMPFFERAIDLGINFFDTADMYSEGESERILGNAIKASGLPRADLVIATKVFFPLSDGVNAGGLSRKHIRHASTPRWSGSIWTTSISIRSTGSTGRRRWRRSSRA